MTLAAFILAVVAGAWGVFERAWVVVLLALAIILMLWPVVVH